MGESINLITYFKVYLLLEFESSSAGIVFPFFSVTPQVTGSHFTVLLDSDSWCCLSCHRMPSQVMSSS